MLLGGNSYAFAFPRFFTDEWGKMGENENISVIFFYILQKKINFAENSLLRLLLRLRKSALPMG